LYYLHTYFNCFHENAYGVNGVDKTSTFFFLFFFLNKKIKQPVGWIQLSVLALIKPLISEVKNEKNLRGIIAFTTTNYKLM
jgi:hypothetical protein